MAHPEPHRTPSRIIPSNTPMRFRKLRIAWSVFWGLACVVLIVLWVRSYRYGDRLRTENFTHEDSQKRLYVVQSGRGFVRLSVAKQDARGEWAISYRPSKLFGLGLSRTNSSTTVNVPYWFPMIVSAAMAFTPWVNWRFSLRTLLIATTLVAVVLGLIAWSIR
jgi:hypothetical protein